MAAARPEWLKLTGETPLEPALPICDPHHHFWDRAEERYLVEELLQDVRSGHHIVSTVFIECRERWRTDGPEEMRPVGETEFVERIVGPQGKYGETAVAAGIVGFADLSAGAAVAPVLEAHLAASPKRFRGIRHSCTWDASAAVKTATPGIPRGLMLDSGFRAGLACLGRYGLSFEAWLYHPQLPEFAALARAVPGVPMILNHVGGLLGVGPYAGKRDEVFQVWKRGIAEVAACPNVVVKLGGLGMVRCGYNWHMRPTPPDSTALMQATAPYYLYCIEQFGPKRCMFESNFPVDKISCAYGVLWNSFKRMTIDFSPAERAALFHDTAARAYRLMS
ncbi:MAG TPA: amidohydrolase family protein [Candidatus Methylomirabilis sp.]|nr:amidohydrolase family protein [Candidatus Methylomirabilis sp.]HSC70506.1 amidohydrolase family protein [Candidatus Methylomirabilis sp.]